MTETDKQSILVMVKGIIDYMRSASFNPKLKRNSTKNLTLCVKRLLDNLEQYPRLNEVTAH